ncbi:PPOX class F420-dependent oxidoreductase [Actinomadura latina]|uniref:PPOX class F420-dependent oxidoreductase n=1 Tax=Actinomadura latina TaxID=163603 RepID=A0A846YVP4_9ACTN|nr:PPOX class F420-dependent oxidoreductase [Actinomadura latina]NKZ02153.1 PPOX class F420-dependent oxidoreductase [Actinomadura latina]
MIFTAAEITYLAGHSLGRLATIGAGGAPQVQPVAFWMNADTGSIDIGGPALTRSQKFRNVQADPRVSFVVDDQSETPNPLGQTGRGIEVRGEVEIVVLDRPLIEAFSNETFRIHPRRIITWNVEEFGPALPERLPHLQGYNFRNISH